MKLSSPPLGLGFSAFLALALSFSFTSLPSVVLASASAGSATASAGNTPGLGSRIYHLTEDIVGAGFYSHFEWENVTDPSHGRVTYTTQQTSIAQNLSYATSSNTFVLRADSTTVLDPNGPGRASFRVRSRRVYRGHVAVFDIKHMPQGCGTWPGIRETKESDKPKGGLIDILEGINDEPPDLITLHTVANCTMPANRTQTGTNAQLDCNVAANANAGCGVYVPGEGRSYGVGFNRNGGGWYAIERTTEHISIWFWARDDRSVPREVRDASVSLPAVVVVDPRNWGVPVAYFPNTSCDFETHFEEHNIIINLTLCGDWAGSAYPPTCPSTCVDHVNNDPAAFEEAYFEFASIRVYEPLA